MMRSEQYYFLDDDDINSNSHTNENNIDHSNKSHLMKSKIPLSTFGNNNKSDVSAITTSEAVTVTAKNN